MSARFECCTQLRLETIKRSGTDNGIEFLEVLDKATPPGAPRQQTLFVRLLRPGFTPNPDNLRISGGERIPTVGILWCAPANALPPQAEAGLAASVDDLPRTLVVRTDSSGDHSTYTLAIVANSGSNDPPQGFDARLSVIQFSFKVECPSDFDCLSSLQCPVAARPRPDIDYLAKDYQGFRRLMLDRMNLLVPGWSERSPADLGIMLVELLAYAADNLSYRQDSIANEAYLATARQRISVRRHARLVDYYMHEGCNARAFVHFKIKGSPVDLAKGTQLLANRPELDIVIEPGSEELRNAIRDGALVFETAHRALLRQSFNQLSFYTWGDQACCLARGATRATLRGRLRDLNAGDILMFEEVVSPTTLVQEDADRTHRWAVRLTAVTLTKDASGGLFKPVPDNNPVDVTEIQWDAADALPFALCLSVAGRPDVEISVARGNIVLVDHGRTISGEPLEEVPPDTLKIAAAAPGGSCKQVEPKLAPARFHPVLPRSPLTHGFDLDSLLAVEINNDQMWWPASSLLVLPAREAIPSIGLAGTAGETWSPRRDLLESAAEAADFVVEVTDDGAALLRFGDGINGKRPKAGMVFAASYRVGNGAAGNVGAEAIRHIVHAAGGSFDLVRNPMPAAGGVDPEDIEAVRRDAPDAFRVQERAVTPADYAAAAERQIEVQRAAATFRWTGSWYTVFVSADRYGGLAVDQPFSARLRRGLERFRMAGYDLDVVDPRYVPLEVELHICVKPDYFRADVLRAVQEVLSSKVLPDGSLGLFHPDNFTFGQAVYLSGIVAAAQSVEGVDAVRPQLFRRMFGASATSLADGVIPISGVEVAQLAQDPDFRERGTLKLHTGGGK